MARHTIEVHTYNTNAREARELSKAIDEFANTWLKNYWKGMGYNTEHSECPSAWVDSTIKEREG